MDDFNKMSEDDDDLEALRLAALQSLKRKSQINDTTNQFNNKNFMNERLKNRRGKYFHSNKNRNLRNNGQSSNWNRNSNLIAVPVISNDNNNENDDAKRLILPQDRYCKNTIINDNNDININSPLSKFDRYDNSDRSDSESDDNDTICINQIDNNDDKEQQDDTLKRTNSLDALMEELENEINGETKKIDEKIKDEKVKNKKKKRTTENETVITTTTTTSPTKTTIAKENLKPDCSDNNKPNITPKKINFPKKKWLSRNSRRHNFQQQQQHKEFLPPIIHQQQQLCNIVPQFPPTIPLQFPIYNQQYENLYQSQINIFEQQRFPELPPRVPIYDQQQQQQISPLHINTDGFTTTTTTPIMAPLSPRSAAFVLENRAIIEKRKRRSYSPSSRSTCSSISNHSRLSLSPRYRRSKSRSPLIIKRQYPSKSPIRRVLPLKNPKNPPSIHERLGIKNDNKTDNNDKLTIIKDEKKFDDPVMEARRKKFESNQLIMKEGVIRLKIKNDQNHELNEEKNDVDNNNDDDDDDGIDEDALLDDIHDDDLEINTKFDVFFSDEESNSDNEGRFKIKQQQQNEEKIVVLPFTKLINGTKTNIDTKLKNNDNDNKDKLKNNNNNNNDNSRNERRKRYRSKSPNNQQSSSSSSSKKIALKTKKIDKTNKAINSFPIDNKKIEIKIRNPAKYEENDDKNKDNGRKVEIMVTTTTTTTTDNDNNENKDNSGKICEGDLRTQLSRKRAERQKQPLPDVVPSRLLQNALQSVGFDKVKKIKIDKNDNKDGKLPIRLRLGTTTPTTITTSTTTTTTTTTSSSNSSSGNNTDGFGKKLRKRGCLEQV